MVLIFGWGAGEAQDLGEVAPAICPNCHNHVFLHHIRSEKRVSLYFVPLVPYGTNEYLACPVCRQGLELRPEHRGAVSDMHASTALLRRGALTEEFYRSRVEHFWRVLGVAPSGQQVLHPAPTIPPPQPSPELEVETAAPPAPTLAQRLGDLARLHAGGVLTDDEFAAAKKRLLEA